MDVSEGLEPIERPFERVVREMLDEGWAEEWARTSAERDKRLLDRRHKEEILSDEPDGVSEGGDED